MNNLFEEFVAELLKRNSGKIELGSGRQLKNVRRQRSLGKLFNELNMYVDLVLTDDDDYSFLVDTKYKVLNTAERHGGISQSDFYQMYAYGSAGKLCYYDIVLLYPETSGLRRTFRQKDDLWLHVRQFDPRKIYDPENGRLNEMGVVKELGEALSNFRPPG
jgi:5-methylcytosine-specific restriction enzyme subunit McrC